MTEPMQLDEARAHQAAYTETVPAAGQRPPTCWLNYPHRVVPDPVKPLGPNLLGEFLWPVDVQPDEPEAGMTMVGFSLIAPPGWQVAWGPDGRPMALQVPQR